MEDASQGKEKRQDKFIEDLKIYDSYLEEVYNRHLAEEQKKDKGAMVISLDEIPDQDEEDRLTQLSAKLGRYTRSLRRKESEFAKRGRLHPRATTQMLISAIYKRDTLRLLLERGEVNTFVLFDTYREMKGRVVLKEFGDACGAIHNYVKTGGEEVVNGGLPLK